MARNQMSLTARMKLRGFDLSHAVPFECGVTVRCSQCEAVVICGVPTHEVGCPNIVVKCRECGDYGHRDCGLFPEEE